MKFTKIRKLSEVANEYDVIMFDLWGVLIEGNALYPNVEGVVNKLMQHKQVLFVSNAPRIKHHAAERLRNFGINCSDDQMFTSGQMSRDLVDSDSRNIVYNLSHGNYPNTIEEGCRLTRNLEEATILLLTAQIEEGEDLEMFNPVLKRALELGLPCVCANPDKTIPNQGKLRYCPGYFADIYEKMGGKVTVIGKPGKDIFLNAIESLSVKPTLDRVLMIGDTLETDILGAESAGINSALVLTGNANLILSRCRTEEEKLTAISEYCTLHGTIPTMLIDITS